MAGALFWPLRHDPWLDNGLEVWGRILDHVASQHPELLRCQWQPDGLLLEVKDGDRLVPVLDDQLVSWRERNLFHAYTTKQGERRRRLLDYIGFNQQPRNQWPLPYLESQQKRQDLLRAVLAQGKEGDRPCPLCGWGVSTAPPALTLSVYPLVTKNKAFSGARTRWTGEGFEGRPTNVPACHRCYLLGALAWADDSLLYLCGLGRDPKSSVAVAILPSPPDPDLVSLHRQKQAYRGQLDHGRHHRTNVHFRPPAVSPRTQPERSDEDAEEVRAPVERRPVVEGRYALLLAFLEACLSEVAQRHGGRLTFREALRSVPQGWLFVAIPQGRMKNISAHDLVLDQPTLALLVRLVEAGIQPYAHIFAQLSLADDRGKALYDEQAEMREAMAQGLLTDTFSVFARALLPRPRRQVRIYGETGPIERLVKEWRWKEMEEHLETVRKAGYALAEIAASRRQPVVLYNLERVRTRSDLLSMLKEAVHRLIGLDAQEMRYISVAAIEDLLQLVHRDTVPFEDLKNTLFVFAGIAYARKAMAQAKAQQGGEGDA